MKKFIIIIATFFILQTSSAQTFKELQVIPFDTTNAFEMKIWFPVRAAHCKVRLRVFDSKMKLVRSFLENRKIKNGYYNIYWDEKDDSGNFVAEGNYQVATVSCDYKRLEPIKVKYRNGENAILTSVGEDLKNLSLDIRLLQDSLHLSLDIMNRRLIKVDSLFTDSLVVGESCTLHWIPDKLKPTGNYFYKLKVNDFEHYIPFKYNK